MYVTTSGQNFTQPLMFITNVLGSDNVMYAADYPYESMAPRKAIDALPLSDSDKRKIFAGNAKRVFNPVEIRRLIRIGLCRAAPLRAIARLAYPKFHLSRVGNPGEVGSILP